MKKDGIVISGIIAILAIVVMVSGCTSSTDNTTSEENKTLTPEEKAEINQMLALSKDPELLSAIDTFVAEVYPDPIYNPVVDYVSVYKIISDNKIELSLTVNWTTAQGDRVQDKYMGTWVKTNGVWKDADDFTPRIYTKKDGKIYSPGELMY